jgi:hypothetical protein
MILSLILHISYQNTKLLTIKHSFFLLEATFGPCYTLIITTSLFKFIQHFQVYKNIISIFTLIFIIAFSKKMVHSFCCEPDAELKQVLENLHAMIPWQPRFNAMVPWHSDSMSQYQGTQSQWPGTRALRFNATVLRYSISMLYHTTQC